MAWSRLELRYYSRRCSFRSSVNCRILRDSQPRVKICSVNISGFEWATTMATWLLLIKLCTTTTTPLPSSLSLLWPTFNYCKITTLNINFMIGILSPKCEILNPLASLRKRKGVAQTLRNRSICNKPDFTHGGGESAATTVRAFPWCNVILLKKNWTCSSLWIVKAFITHIFCKKFPVV